MRRRSGFALPICLLWRLRKPTLARLETSDWCAVQRAIAPPSVKRRLAAILSADVKGYSRLMAADEEGTLRTLNAYRLKMDALIGGRDGRIVGTAGDSVLAEFPSAVEAVRCAVEIQAELAALNAELPKERRLEFRIGINLGDVMVEGETCSVMASTSPPDYRRSPSLAASTSPAASTIRSRASCRSALTSWASRRSRTSWSRSGSIGCARIVPPCAAACRSAGVLGPRSLRESSCWWS